jgi:hypothetical protein
LNGKSLNFVKQTEIDSSRLVAQLNYQNSDFSIGLTTGVYSRSYFFRLFSNKKLSIMMYPTIKSSIESIFLNQYPQFSNINVSIPLQEELIDLERKLIFGLNILIIIDRKMADDVININRSIFNKIQNIDLIILL